MTHPYQQMIDQAAERIGATVAWLPDRPTDRSVGVVTRGPLSTRVYGDAIGLNHDGPSRTAKDKVVTSQVLRDAGVDAVEHLPLPDDTFRLAPWAFPLVIKPVDGANGAGVRRFDGPIGLAQWSSSHTPRVGRWCYSPELTIEHEIREVVLDGTPGGVRFDKVRPEGRWEHNLSSGAYPQILEPHEWPETTDLAARAAEALGLRFCTVDVIVVRVAGPRARVGGPRGSLRCMVLEVNSVVSLDKFAEHSDTHWNLAVGVFATALDRKLSNTDRELD